MGWIRFVIEDATLVVDMGRIGIDISNCMSRGRYSGGIIDLDCESRFTIPDPLVESLALKSERLRIEVRLEESLLLFACLDQLLNNVEEK